VTHEPTATYARRLSEEAARIEAAAFLGRYVGTGLCTDLPVAVLFSLGLTCSDEPGLTPVRVDSTCEIESFDERERSWIASCSATLAGAQELIPPGAAWTVSVDDATRAVRIVEEPDVDEMP
jgi:hypothetical protein